jgi:hypothetical protein
MTTTYATVTLWKQDKEAPFSGFDHDQCGNSSKSDQSVPVRRRIKEMGASDGDDRF